MTNTTVNQEEDLMSIQLKLEEDMTERGALRFMRNADYAVKAKSEEGTTYGQQIIKGRIVRLAAAISDWVEKTGTGKAGNNVSAYRFLKDVDANLLAYLTLKHVMAGISTLRTLQHVAVNIGMSVEDELRLADIRSNERKEFDRIVRGANKRSSTHYKHVYAVRAAKMVDSWKTWGSTDRFHVGMKLLDLCIESIGLVEIKTITVSKNRTPKYVAALPDTLAWIEKHNDAVSILRPVFEPMVVQPKDWTCPTDGGYISSSVKPQKLVKISNKVYLEELKHIDMPIVYEAVNALQRTAWQINSQVYEVMSTLWENGSEIAGLPSRNGIAPPVKPHDIETNEVARREYRCEAAKTHMDNLTLRGHRVAFHFTLDIAKRYNSFRKLFFPYQLDFRGRIYAMPHLNPQGADYQKSLLRFAHGKPLGEEGWKWLAIHGSNVAGNDKVSLEDRVNWVLDNEEEIIKCANDPYNERGWCTSISGVSIDKPWQFLAFCFEWKGYSEHGESFVSKIPVALDGSASGIQHFSCQTLDESGGRAVNLLPQELPADLYQMVADKVIEQANIDLVSGTEDEIRHDSEGRAYVVEGTKTLAKQWLEFGITRKTTKRSCMTLAYGSKMFGFKEQILEDTLRPAYKSGQPFPFTKDGYMAAHYMAASIWTSINKVLVRAGEAMKWLQEVASIAAAEKLPIRWTTPVGFPVMQLYPELNARRIKTAINGKIIKLVMNEEKETPDKRKMTQGIAPNFVHSTDAAHLMLTVVRAKQEGLTSFAMIHDSFGTTAGETEIMYRVVRESLVEMYQEVDVLEQFRADIADRLEGEPLENLPPTPVKGNLDLSAICDSRYCFA